MSEFTARIIDKIGLHARPAASVVQVASKYVSDVTIYYNERQGNLKSILNVMALAIGYDQKFKIKAEGEDEQEAIEAIKMVMRKEKLIA